MGKNTKTQNATFRRIMTNVPGIVPQPYPIVNYPGTFAIILRKVATPPFSFSFFFVGSPDRKSADFSGNIFRRKHFRRNFFLRIFFGRPLDGRRTVVGRHLDSCPSTCVFQPGHMCPLARTHVSSSQGIRVV